MGSGQLFDCHLVIADEQIVLDGDGYIFRSALAIFGFLEPRQVPSTTVIGTNDQTVFPRP